MRFRLLNAASLIAMTALSGASFAAERFRIDPDHTFVHFAVVHTGVSSVRGRVGVTKGTATLDAAQGAPRLQWRSIPGRWTLA